MSYDIEVTLYRIEDIMKLSTEEALTKRDKFAMAAMQGFLSNDGYDACDKILARDSISCAEALLAGLEKGVEK